MAFRDRRMDLSTEDNFYEGDEAALKEFLVDSKCLEPLSQWTGRFNAFDVLGITKTEIRHSNVLAWLMDPAENHGLGDGVIRGFVNHTARNLEADDIFDDLLMDCDDFSICRECRGIDILAVNEKEKYVLCIENKTFSGEHDNQLERYHTYVEREFPDCRRRFVFLTPDSREASEQESDWLPMGYEDVLGIIEGAMAASTPAAEQREFILEYMDAVRRSILEDRELKEICNRIYAKHRKALDLIYKYRPDTVSKVSDYCREWVRRKAESDETIQPSKEAGDKWNTTFTTGLMDRLVPRGDNPSGVFGKDGHYVYQIHVDDGGDVPKVRLQLVFNFEGLDEGPRGECARVLTAIGETYSLNSGPLVKKARKRTWCTAWRTGYSTVPVDSDEDWDESLGKKLDGMYGQLKDFESKLSEDPWVGGKLSADASVPGQGDGTC